jgi:hypothetical protein
MSDAWICRGPLKIRLYRFPGWLFLDPFLQSSTAILIENPHAVSVVVVVVPMAFASEERRTCPYISSSSRCAEEATPTHGQATTTTTTAALLSIFYR